MTQLCECARVCTCTASRKGPRWGPARHVYRTTCESGSSVSRAGSTCTCTYRMGYPQQSSASAERHACLEQNTALTRCAADPPPRPLRPRLPDSSSSSLDRTTADTDQHETPLKPVWAGSDGLELTGFCWSDSGFLWTGNGAPPLSEPLPSVSLVLHHILPGHIQAPPPTGPLHAGGGLTDI